jgi:DNA-binding transcriptional LysR family regulator
MQPTNPRPGPAIDWNQLRIFHTVAEVGSFTGAGNILNLSQSAVSRQIKALEETLKVPLFHRHPRGIALTEMGVELHKAVNEVSDRLALAMERINEFREKPEGPLRITTTMTFGSAWLSSRMNVFYGRYPEISVSLRLVDNVELDLLKGEADVAIRFARQTQLRLVERYLMTVRYHVFASQDYLDKHGTPEKPEDLDHHRIIVYGEDVAAPIADMNWLLFVGRDTAQPREPALRVNSVYGIYRAVRSGLGIAALPYYLSEESTSLVEILPDLVGPSFDVIYVYPEELRHSKRVAVLGNFLASEAEEYKKRYKGLRPTGQGR